MSSELSNCHQLFVPSAHRRQDGAGTGLVTGCQHFFSAQKRILRDVWEIVWGEILTGEMIQFDSYFSNELKSRTSCWFAMHRINLFSEVARMAPVADVRWSTKASAASRWSGAWGCQKATQKGRFVVWSSFVATCWAQKVWQQHTCC